MARAKKTTRKNAQSADGQEQQEADLFDSADDNGVDEEQHNEAVKTKKKAKT